MSTLKKIAALSLASSLALGTIASATFTDSDSIVTSDAVDTLVALGVIHGKPDGSFDPETTVTRAEMAKMIYIIKNGGNDNSSSFAGLSSFNDTQGHWAEGYIAYCEAQGIIAGKSETIFDPDAPVTGIDALKMVLVTLGYNAEIEGLVGTSYITKTLALSGTLTTDYDQAFTEGSQRQYAAQILYNALDVETIKYSDGIAQDTGYTLGEKSLGLSTATVDVLLEVSEDGTFTAYDNGTAVKLTIQSDLSSHIGQKVDIKYNTKNGNIYGVKTNYDDVEIAYNTYELEMGDDENTVEIGDFEINLSNDSDLTNDTVTVIVDGVKKSNSTFETYAKLLSLFNQKDGFGSTMTVYENDDDTYAIVIDTYKIAQVTSTTGDRINASGYYYYDDEQIASDVTKGDYVKITTDLYKENYVIEVIEAEEGSIDAKKSEEVKVNGQWIYLVSEDAASTGDEVKFYLVNGVAHKLEVTEEAVAIGDYLLVKDVASYDSRYDEYYAKVIFADGTEKTIVVDEVTVDGTDYEDGDILTTISGAGLYTFSVSKDVYSLTKVLSTDDDTLEVGSIVEDEMISTNGDKITIADDAIVIVRYTESGKTSYSFESVTGEEVIDWDTTTTVQDDATSFMVYDTVNGIDYVKLAFVNLGTDTMPNSKVDNNYAVVLDDAYQAKNSDGDVVYMITIFDGVDTMLVETDDKTAAKIIDGDIIVFDLESDGVTLDSFSIVSESNTQSDDAFAYYAVTGYNGSDTIVLYSQSSDISSKKYEIDSDDTTIIFIDSDDLVGYEDGKIEIAEDDDGDYTENVRAIIDDSGLVLLLVVDINGAYIGGTDAYGNIIK